MSKAFIITNDYNIKQVQVIVKDREFLVGGIKGEVRLKSKNIISGNRKEGADFGRSTVPAPSRGC
jgi:hypothetical protein